MGAGEHGGFGHTSGSSKSNIFTRVQFEGTARVYGEVRDISRRVYQRNDIDFSMTDKSGKTNLERMREGHAPIGNDGKPVQLHHVLQEENGPVVEIREVTHREYNRTLHGLVGNGGSFRNDPVLDRQYRNFKSAYWKWRARQYMERGR